MVGPKNKNIAAMRLHKVVGKFIHKNLVPCVDCASGYDLTTAINATWKNIEIMSERIRRGIHQKALPLAD